MGYGDLQFFDLIVFAGVAGFLIYRLRSVLGKRQGFEKKTNDRVTLKEESNEPLQEIP